MKNALLLKHVIYNTIIYLIHIHFIVYTCIYMRPRQLFFCKSDCLGCAVLLCLVVCLTLLAPFSLVSFFISLSCTTYTIHVSKTKCYLEDAVQVV